MGVIIDGKAVAAKVREEVAQEIQELEQAGVHAKLVVIQVGDNPASTVYVRNKEKACTQVGIDSEIIKLPASITEDALLKEVDALNADDAVDGILVQLPLPDHISETAVKDAIHPDKDVDGFHPVNMGRLMAGEDGFVPCTPAGIVRLLDEYEIPIEGRHCVIIGRSQIVGKPMALLMLARHATVTVCHSRTQDLAAIAREADILISAVGKVGLVDSDCVKDGAVVIDVAMNRNEEGKLCGDVIFDEVKEKTSAITPVPGGVGPMTVAMLLKNCLFSAKRKAVLR